MISNGYILACLLIAGALTWGMRALPFAVLAKIRGSSLVGFLSEQMPLGVMIILLLYLLQDAPREGAGTLMFVVAVALTAGVHLWRRDALLSIFAGTLTYVLLLAMT